MNTLATRICALDGCDVEFTPKDEKHRFHADRCRAAAAREKALTGPSGKITGGPRKNKRGVSITVTFTGDDAERALRLDPGQLVHVYHQSEGNHV